MSYRCETCGGHVRHGLTRRTYALTRQVPVHASVPAGPQRSEIARELAVCGTCHTMLSGGVSLAQVRKAGRERLRQQGQEPPSLPPVLTPTLALPQGSVAVVQAIPSIPAARRVTFNAGKAGRKGGA